MLWPRREQPKFVGIRTKHYSAVVRRLLQHFAHGTTAVIDRKRVPSSEFPQLIASWCTNARIRATRDFRLLRGRTDLAGFHDTPDEMWIVANELAFVQRLAAEKLVRYDAPKNI